MDETSIRNLVYAQRAYFLTGKTLPLSFRLEMLNKLESLIKNYLDKLNEAFILDYNKHPFDVLSTEVFLVLEEIKYFKKHLKTLMKSKIFRQRQFYRAAILCYRLPMTVR